MRRAGESRADKEWLKALGRHIERLILEGGYKSAYEFWIECAGDDLSRATLNYVLKGETDPKATTLRTIARLLKIHPSRMLEVKETRKS